MGFSDTQIHSLRRRVPTRNIKSRMSGNKELSYIEGWYALDRANHIFGFDGWSRETMDVHCVSARAERGTFAAVYTARVRISVWSGDRTIVRDGHGSAEAAAPSAGEAHDRALKSAETDATKRALATFGRAFGLALYAERVRSRAAAAGRAVKGQLSSNSSGAETSASLRQAPSAIPPTKGAKSLLAARSAGPSALAFPKLDRIRDKEHLRYVASQPCLLCNASPSDAHHLRFAQPRALGRKVGDDLTVPLCRAHHRELHHGGNEVAWWHDMGIDPLEIARQLRDESLGHSIPAV